MQPQAPYQQLEGSAMSRKKRSEEHENHERWLVSYADFITLLFAFFVVMYSISSVNEGKYRVLSDSIVAAFRDPARSLQPIQIGDLSRVPEHADSVLDRSDPTIELFRVPLPVPPQQAAESKRFAASEHAAPDQSEAQEGMDAASEQLADSIEAAMANLMDQGLIDVRRDKRWIEVEINTSILFPSGSAQLSAQAQPVLRQLAGTLQELPNIIHVEGFTDNVPINNFEFRSNWELSAARAASVVHLFSRLGIDPERMAAVGYGEYRPVASNETPEGRAKNRRVVLVIMSGADARVTERLNHLQTRREAEPVPRRQAPPGPVDPPHTDAAGAS
jgi:chemotaxis protein MotB